MAYIGLAKPVVATLTESGGTASYSNGFAFGKAVSLDITPNYNEASLYGDNQQEESTKEFKNATVSLGITSIPVSAFSTMFGHAVTTEDAYAVLATKPADWDTDCTKYYSRTGTAPSYTYTPVEASTTFTANTYYQKNSVSKVLYKTGDSSNYVGFGVYVEEIISGVKSYTAIWMNKVKFSQSAESYSTKGDSVEFKTPTVEGEALGLSNTEWREVKVFATEAEAQTYLNTKAGING